GYRGNMIKKGKPKGHSKVESGLLIALGCADASADDMEPMLQRYQEWGFTTMFVTLRRVNCVMQWLMEQLALTLEQWQGQGPVVVHMFGTSGMLTYAKLLVHLGRTGRTEYQGAIVACIYDSCTCWHFHPQLVTQEIYVAWYSYAIGALEELRREHPALLNSAEEANSPRPRTSSNSMAASQSSVSLSDSQTSMPRTPSQTSLPQSGHSVHSRSELSARHDAEAESSSYAEQIDFFKLFLNSQHAVDLYETVWDWESVFTQGFSNAPKVPSLMMASEGVSDDIPESCREAIKRKLEFSSTEVPVFEVTFEMSSHCQHFHQHEELYMANLNLFLDDHVVSPQSRMWQQPLSFTQFMSPRISVGTASLTSPAVFLGKIMDMTTNVTKLPGW
ncbi:hypothetical protein CYMTET_31548, partial [Cymbomonas tetramitiformis]